MAQNRTANLAIFESQLHHRSRAVPSSTSLVFSSSPTLHTDPIPLLQPGNLNNSKFESFRSWLRVQRSWLWDLRPLGVKYTDNHRDRLIEKVDYQLERLDRLERDCWDRAKVAAKVPGIYCFSDEEGPIVVAPCMLPYFIHLICADLYMQHPSWKLGGICSPF